MKKLITYRLLILALCCVASLQIKSEEKSCKINREYNFNPKLIHHSPMLDKEESIYYKPEVFFIKI
jgi:hypothetical protein